MAATGRYIVQLDCERRMTSAVIVQIFDDGGDGSLSAAEEAGLQDFILDAESEVEQVIRKTYGTAGLVWLQGQGVSAPRSVKRMCLDLFEVRAIKRHPSYIRGEWLEREKRVEEDLDKLRVRELELDTLGSPEPAANEGAEVLSGNPDDTEPVAKTFLDGMGVF